MIFERKVQFKPTSLKRHRFSRWGKHTYDPSSKDKKDFVNKIDNLPNKPFTGPLKAVLLFYEQRPKSHYRTGKYSHILKEKSPIYNTSKRDIDNFCKFVLDALNKILYVDDSQIISLESKKYYTKNRDEGYIHIKFTEIKKKEDKNEDKHLDNLTQTLLICK